MQAPPDQILQQIIEAYCSRTAGKWAVPQAPRLTKSGGRRGGFPPGYARKCPRERGEWLAGEECKQFVLAGKISQQQVDAEAKRLRKALRKITRLAPTLAWIDDFESGWPFPPDPDTPAVRMRQAWVVLIKDELPVLWPAAYVSDRGATFDVVCLETDSRRHRMELVPGGGARRITESPTEAAREQLIRGGRMIWMPLATENEKTLRRQIARHINQKPRRNAN